MKTDHSQYLLIHRTHSAIMTRQLAVPTSTQGSHCYTYDSITHSVPASIQDYHLHDRQLTVPASTRGPHCYMYDSSTRSVHNAELTLDQSQCLLVRKIHTTIYDLITRSVY